MSGFAFFLSFLFFVFFFLILNICYIVGGEKKWLSKLRANGEHKKKRRMDELPSGYGLQATPN